MFENAGAKVKTLANVVFGIGVVVAVVLFLFGFAASSETPWLLPVYWIAAAVEVLGTWITGVVLTAVGDAAENSEAALAKVNELSRKIGNVNVAEMSKGGRIITNAVSYDNYGSRAQKNSTTERIPAWKRVQMEREKFTPGKCEMCGGEFEQIADCEIRDDLGIRYRKLCQECMAKSNAVLRK